jgi:hypothetical protein
MAKIVNLRRRRLRKARAVVKVRTLHRQRAELALCHALELCRQLQTELDVARETLAAQRKQWRAA